MVLASAKNSATDWSNRTTLKAPPPTSFTNPLVSRMNLLAANWFTAPPAVAMIQVLVTVLVKCAAGPGALPSSETSLMVNFWLSSGWLVAVIVRSPAMLSRSQPVPALPAASFIVQVWLPPGFQTCTAGRPPNVAPQPVVPGK